MITRFELLLVVRTQLGDRALLRRTLAVEAAVEALAGSAPQGSDHWCLAGLGSGLDLKLCEKNPAALGRVAAEQLLAEGAGEEVAAAVRERRERPPEALSAMGAALSVAEVLADDILADLDQGDAVWDIDAGAVARRLRRAAELRGDARARRVLECLGVIGLELEDAAEIVVTGMLAIAGDL